MEKENYPANAIDGNVIGDMLNDLDYVAMFAAYWPGDPNSARI